MSANLVDSVRPRRWGAPLPRSTRGVGPLYTSRTSIFRNSDMGFVRVAEYTQASVCSPQIPALFSSVLFSSHCVVGWAGISILCSFSAIVSVSVSVSQAVVMRVMLEFALMVMNSCLSAVTNIQLRSRSRPVRRSSVDFTSKPRHDFTGYTRRRTISSVAGRGGVDLATYRSPILRERMKMRTMGSINELATNKVCASEEFGVI